MNAKKVSIFLAGFIWLLVAFRIGGRAIDWLQPYFQEPNWKLSLLLVSLIIAGGKAFTVLKKAAARNLGNIDKVKETPINYFIGWLILYNTKGVVFISLMIGLGFFLRYLRSIGADPYNIFGFIYLGIALALAIGSFFYFKELKKH
jgi:hypothetical protein